MGGSNRREFLNNLLPEKLKKETEYDITKDEIFLKYSNKTSPVKIPNSTFRKNPQSVRIYD